MMSTAFRHSLWALVATCLLAGAGQARADVAPLPRLKPAPVYHSEVLSPAEMELLREGLDAAEDAAWSRAETLQETLSDPVAAKLILWRRATSDPRMTFAELDQALTELEGWPRRHVIQSEAESKIGRAGLTAGEIVAWFDATPARSGRGRIEYAKALFAVGRTDEGEETLRAAWRGSVLPLSVQNETLARHGDLLTTADHVTRVDYLLWSGQRTATRRLLSRVPTSERRLAEARLKLMGRERGVDSAVARVPASLKSHPGLLYERARWRRGSRRTSDALPLVLEIPADSGPLVAREKVWTERRIHISRILDDEEYEAAYRLASNHGLTRGASFAGAEFLAGWIALRRLEDIPAAETHFANLEEGVSTPISVSRAAFWRGRAAEAAGKVSTARTHYRRAAEHPTAFYGQLASTRLGGGAATALLPPEARPSQADRDAFETRDLVKATRLLSELDELRLFREFAFFLDDRLERPTDFALLAELSRAYGQYGVATRHGKTALSRGLIEPSAAYPVIPLPDLPADAPEDALLHALMRQESEFYTRAVSPVGARGMMQLMPRTARATARAIGQPYRRNWLTDDPDYNIKLGAAHLSELIEEFDGSYILAATAYNAGGSRARRWIGDYGDPRADHVDPIDWMESIPFSETRNYVQRIMENLQIYRARLGDGALRITLDQDLTRGG